ncbi:hypothetical protein [Mesorhizobium sp. M0244]
MFAGFEAQARGTVSIGGRVGEPLGSASAQPGNGFSEL